MDIDPEKTPTVHMCAWGMLPEPVPFELQKQIRKELASCGYALDYYSIAETFFLQPLDERDYGGSFRYLANACRRALGIEGWLYHR